MFHRPPTLHRLFFAILPPPVLARRIAAAAGWFGRDGAGALAAARLHVTLCILDDHAELPVGLVADLRGIGDRLDLPPVAVTLEIASGSASSVALRPAHVLPDVMHLHDHLATLARAVGIRARDGYRFAPHLTLGYRNGTPFHQPVAPIHWLAEEIVLIDSHVGSTRHEVLGRWRLDGREAQLRLL